MAEIETVGVLGAGVMGAGIAARIASTGRKVVLLDVVPDEGHAPDRNRLAEAGVKNQLKAAGFMHPKYASRIECGNIDDDLEKLRRCQWVIEAIQEDEEAKKKLYKKVGTVLADDAILSSNTSTFQRKTLMEGMPEIDGKPKIEAMSEDLAKRFIITHGYNPFRWTPLLEVVSGPENNPDHVKAICDFADKELGKTIIECKDTPAFIGNRIGIYWLMQGMQQAKELGLTVQQADAVMGAPVGIPKTGIFGLLDVVGLKLVPQLGTSMKKALPADDGFCKVFHEPEFLAKMIATGAIGRMAKDNKGGFYRLDKHADGTKTKQVINLETGEYSPQTEEAPLDSVKAAFAALKAGKDGLKPLLEHDDKGGKYAWNVLSSTLCYTASQIPAISDDISLVDETMRKGYNWQVGPFQMIDKLGDDKKLGVEWFCERLEKDGKDIPAILKLARDQKKTFYREENGQMMALDINGDYKPVQAPEGYLTLADVKRKQKTPLLQSKAASLWDMGDGVTCLELTSSGNSVNFDTLDMMEKTIQFMKDHKGEYKGLVIYNDTNTFCAGVDLKMVSAAASTGNLDLVSSIVTRGQKVMMDLKRLDVPVVAGTAGAGLGGGCELAMHCSGIQAHADSALGLVERKIGLIPGWGGCKELLLRHTNAEGVTDIRTVFGNILQTKVSGSAEEARDMKILREGDGISMNRDRVLFDAKARCLEMANRDGGYKPPVPQTLNLPGGEGAETVKAMVAGAKKGAQAMGLQVSPHDELLAGVLARVLTGSSLPAGQRATEEDILKLEHDAIMELAKTPETFALLTTGKPLKAGADAGDKPKVAVAASASK